MSTRREEAATADSPLLAQDGFSPYAVRSRWGPHVTIQAGVVSSGRFWTTTSRESLKARSVRSHGEAAALREHDDGLVEVLAGPTVSLDAQRPWGAADDLGAVLGAGPAVLRMLGEQLRQVFGYLDAHDTIPLDWLPHNRVVLATRIERRLVLDGFDLVEGVGAWQPRLPHPGRRLRPHPTPPTPLDVPDGAKQLVREDRPARIGLSTPDGPVVVPGRWRGDDRFTVSADALGAMAADVPGRGAATFDESNSCRPDEKRGVMLRGALSLVDLDRRQAVLALHTERVTTWDGFTAAAGA